MKNKKNSFPKKCACGKVYSEDAWKRLGLVGIQRDVAGVDAGEMRDCVCGSTMIVLVIKKKED